MKNILLFSILLFTGLMATANAQSDHVVINEIEINPPGDDTKSALEWVELYNPTTSKIDISGWQIASSTGVKKTLIIPAGSSIDSGKFLTFTYQNLWFTDANESIELKDKNGIVLDKTPLFSDTKNDFNTWQRIYDGYDNDKIDDWKFVTSTAGSSNGKLPITNEKENVLVSISSNKPSYIFGETAIIEGTVSKQLFVTSPYFQAEEILVRISGPDFDKKISLHPNLNLTYKTTLNLQQVLGIKEGVYSVSVSYGGQTSQTTFSVGNKITVTSTPEIGILTISADKSKYLPGDTVLVTGSITKIIPFEGMKFNISDPNGKIISNGNLFPTDGTFSTKVYLTTVSPIYGQYKITGEYSDKIAIANFEVVSDIKEETEISLWTNKESYSLGDTVNITGRLNKVWVGFMNLEIIQTSTSIEQSKLDGKNSGFKISDIIKISGDGSFAYSFKIPETNSRLGDYKISISKDVGSVSKVIRVVSSIDMDAASSFSLSTDKVIYDLGDTMTINGFIGNYATGPNLQTFPVKISISRADGSPLEIVALPPGAKTRQNNGLVVAYEFATIPDSSGRFSVQTKITQNIFSEGSFKVKAEYRNLAQTTSFGITDPLKSSGIAILTLNKQVYGLGEPVLLTGILPPTADGSVKISLTKSDGSVINSGATVNNQRFSWSWVTPVAEKPLAIKIDDRSKSSTNYGVYKINVSTASSGKDIFFKVSPDPSNDSLSLSPLNISTEKSLYKAGEKLKVIGNIIRTEQTSKGSTVPERVTIIVIDGKFPYKQITEASVYPDQGGNFNSLFELPVTIFTEGSYKVKATYSGKKAESTFAVANDFSFDSNEKLSLVVVTDKPTYHPGDTVVVSGKPNKIVYLEKFEVSVIQKAPGALTCGSFFCGKHLGPVTEIKPSSSGSFSYEIKIPDSASSVGSYEITIDAGFTTKSMLFNVVEKPLISKPASSKLSTIEKVNRITDDKISITTSKKTVDDVNLKPRVFSGSLLTAKVDQSTVNLKVTSETGTCIIGPEDGCLVNDSTRKTGKIYQVVSVDGKHLNVRYTGPDVYLEKFDILPESGTEFLSDETWNVDIIRDEDQSSRFYYRINYSVE